MERAYQSLKTTSGIDVHELFGLVLDKWDINCLPWNAQSGLPLPQIGTSWLQGSGVTFTSWVHLCDAFDIIFEEGQSTLEAFCTAFGWSDSLELAKRYIFLCEEDEHKEGVSNGKRVLNGILGVKNVDAGLAPHVTKKREIHCGPLCTPSPLAKKRRMDVSSSGAIAQRGACLV